MPPGDAMPRRDLVDRQFDGHAERPWSDLTAEQKLDWIWEGMCLLRAGERGRSASPAPPSVPAHDPADRLLIRR